jgi:branched-chain amino acid transport system ATP-binding protein
MASPLVVRGLTKSFGGLRAVDRVDLQVEPGHVHSLIGPNGAGKTTAFNCISGFLRPDEGEVMLDAHDVTGWEPHRLVRAGMARTFQVTNVFGELTVFENVALATRSKDGKNLQMWRNAESPHAATDTLKMLGLDERAREKADHLGHGERRVLEIAIALALRPGMLLLDEPTAGMSLAESEHMASLIRGLAPRTTVLLVEHDMEIVLGISDAVTVMNEGRVIASGSPAAISRDARVQNAYLGTAHASSG